MSSRVFTPRPSSLWTIVKQCGITHAVGAMDFSRGLDVPHADLADAVGVSRKTINTIERGVFAPSAVLALRIARVFDKPVEEVFSLVDG